MKYKYTDKIDLYEITQRVFNYSKEFEMLRQSFFNKISGFNIRSTFDKLQHNDKDKKTTNLMNVLEKKYLYLPMISRVTK